MMIIIIIKYWKINCIDASYKKSQNFKKLLLTYDPLIADTNTYSLVRVINKLDFHQSSH